MLCIGDLVVGRFNIKSHLFQCKYHITARIFTGIHRSDIKVTCALICQCRRLTVFPRLEQEKFAFRSHVEDIAFFFGFRHGLPQDPSGISCKRLAFCRINIAEHTRYLAMLRSPGKYRPGVRVRIQVHIRFLHACEPVDGRAVKHIIVVQRLFQLPRGDRQILQIAEYVCKLQTDELHIFLFRDLQDLFFCEFRHDDLPLKCVYISRNNNSFSVKKQKEHPYFGHSFVSTYAIIKHARSSVNAINISE